MEVPSISRESTIKTMIGAASHVEDAVCLCWEDATCDIVHRMHGRSLEEAWCSTKTLRIEHGAIAVRDTA